MCCCFILTISNQANAKTVQLSVDDVVNSVLNKSLVHKEIDINFQKSAIAIYSADIPYDVMLNGKWNHEDSKAETIGGLGNIRDLTDSYSIGAAKKWRTGSYLGLDYGKIARDSELGATSLALRLPAKQFQNVATLTFKQELWNNSFGYQDQLKQEAADLTTERAKLERDEATEDLLMSAVKLFWDTYSAQENWKQSIAARDKFQQLYKNIEKKFSLGFDDRSELLKTKAELQNQEKNINSAHLIYTTLVEKLYSLSNAAVPGDVELVAEEITAPPPITPNDSGSYENLRKLKSIEKALSASQDELEIAKNNGKPVLNFLMQNSFYGLDENQSPSFKEMSDASKPKYMVGLEFTMRLDNSQAKAEELSKRLQHEETLNQKEKLKVQMQEALVQTERNLQNKYVIYMNAKDTFKVWDKVIQNQEKSHRLGRLTTSELLMDYGSYFRSKMALSIAIAEYKVATYDHKAVRDQLLKSKN
jgi:outer membrane protein TolC